MKLISAKIDNFRLLKDIKLKFSTSEDKNITVIRAANESGKTTLHSALQWGLFGDEGLPDNGKNFRLSPMDETDENSRSNIEVSVEIVFEVTNNSKVERFRIIRFANEKVKNSVFEREKSQVNLSKINETGESSLKNPEANIRRFLPLELREVFFTDGDRALSFIEGKKSEKKKRVENSIKSLLGLNVVQDALDHVNSVSTTLNKKIKKTLPDEEKLSDISSEIEEKEQKKGEFEGELTKLEEQIENLIELEKQADKNLETALKNGDRKILLKSKNNIEKNWDQTLSQIEDYKKDHSKLFKSKSLAKNILKKHLLRSKNKLDQLKKEKQIPSQTIPVLEKYLESPECICGESLDENTSDGSRRLENIQTLIKESQDADIIKKNLTELYYGSNNLFNLDDFGKWSELYKEIFQKKSRASQRLNELGEEQRELEAQIAKIPDVDTNQIRITRNKYKTELKEKREDKFKLETRVYNLKNQIINFKRDRKKLLEADDKGKKLLSEIEVASDVESILSNAINTLRTREIDKVSEEMNSLFLEMIGADKSQSAIINKAEVTHDYNIEVLGQHNNYLDPADDLNGASRRALTISFILALTKISDVEAPNVIDTPLGMMSGYVKRSVLYNVAKNSTQLILLLTHSEIRDCEDILTEKAGVNYTFTSPAHYPAILENSPNVDDSRIMVCDCNHTESCIICKRNETVEYYN